MLFVVCAVYYSQVKKIESHAIEGHEEYSIVAFHLNAEGKALAISNAAAFDGHNWLGHPDFDAGKGKYWLYWVPSQYTAAIKVCIIGVSALI